MVAMLPPMIGEVDSCHASVAEWFIYTSESFRFVKKKGIDKVASLMSFGGFLENNWGGGGAGGGARIVANIIPYSNGTTNDNRMPSSGSISHQPRLVTTAPTTTMAKSMFNSPGLSLALQTNLDEQQGDVNRMGYGWR
ncbi:hypothetical protein K1719_010948 [Acacia pycnantha]|nr:hypothetical protein K1719_010948 [Acacia pycnantha]